MLEVRNVTREFPGVKALDDVSVRFEKGEVHALMGENGAGKSTLMKIVTGIYRPDSGAVYIDGRKIALRDYADCAAYDISMVHQEIQVIPESTVAENIVMDKMKRFRNRLGVLDWKKINQTAKAYLDMVELRVNPTDIIGKMTAAQKQLIQIAKALSANAQYILMDEPTSSLTQYEAQNLFRIIRKLREEGRCIIFVSHKIEEVLQVCDRVTVLRDGRVIGTQKVEALTRNDLVKMMKQKVSIGKWLAAGCDILIIDEPTVGVDVGAKRQIHEIIWNLARNEGKSIILISSDMTEMITLARRILVFRDFEITAEITGLNERECDYAFVSEKIGAAMA